MCRPVTRSGGSRWSRSATCMREGQPRSTEPSRPHASGTLCRRARASMYSRSKRKMLWPSSTSGSRSRMMPRALGQELGLGHQGARQHGGEPGGVGDRDGDDAVGLARRVRELEAGRGGDLDVERHAPQVAEAHAEEGGLPGAQQELVHGIGEEAVRSLGRPRALAGDAQAVVAHPEGLRPRRALREPAVDAVARRAGSPPPRP